MITTQTTQLNQTDSIQTMIMTYGYSRSQTNLPTTIDKGKEIKQVHIQLSMKHKFVTATNSHGLH